MGAAPSHPRTKEQEPWPEEETVEAVVGSRPWQVQVQVSQVVRPPPPPRPPSVHHPAWPSASALEEVLGGQTHAYQVVRFPATQAEVPGRPRAHRSPSPCACPESPCG